MDLSELIAGCRKEEAQAQELLLRYYHKRMFGYCMYLLENVHDAQEVLSDSFLYVLLNIRKFEMQDESSMEKWLITIVKNGCMNLIKKRKRNLFTIQENLPEKKPELMTEYSLVGDHLYLCLRKIKHEFRLVMILKAIEEMEHKEIAYHLKIRVELSRSYYFRARNELKKLIDLNQL